MAAIPPGRGRSRLARGFARIGVLALIGASITAGVASASSRPASSVRPHAGKLAAFGETLALFERSYPEDVGACPDTTCYGPLVASLPPTYEFSYLDVERGRVVGYNQAIKRGTPLLEAELEVAELFPSDAQSNKIEEIKRDLYGASCGVYDIYSKVLKAEFGPHAFGNDGDNVGVELATLTKNGFTRYNPNAIDIAIVTPTYAYNGINC